MLATRRRLQFLAQLADEHVDDLEFGLVHAAVEMVEEHLLGERGALAEREQLQHLVFFAGEMDALSIHFYRLRIEIDAQVAGLDDGLRMPLGAAHDGVDAGDEFVLVEGLRHVVVGAEAKAAHLVLDAGEAGQDEDGRRHLAHAQCLQDLVTAHVGQIEVEENDVVVVELAEVGAFLAQIGGVDVEALGLEHQLDALRCRAVVLDQKDSHSDLLLKALAPESLCPRK